MGLSAITLAYLVTRMEVGQIGYVSLQVSKVVLASHESEGRGIRLSSSLLGCFSFPYSSLILTWRLIVNNLINDRFVAYFFECERRVSRMLYYSFLAFSFLGFVYSFTHRGVPARGCVVHNGEYLIGV